MKRNLKCLYIILAQTVCMAAPIEERPSHGNDHPATFCLDWLLMEEEKTANQWLPFVYTPQNNEKAFVRVERVLDPQTNRVVTLYNEPTIQIESNGVRGTVQEYRTVINSGSVFSLFYSKYGQATAGFSVDKGRLYQRLLSHFKNNPEQLSKDGEVKVFIEIQVYKLDCSTNEFVKESIAKADYILVSLEKDQVELIGFNADSHIGTTGGFPSVPPAGFLQC